jgi:hypothetical protein
VHDGTACVMTDEEAANTTLNVVGADDPGLELLVIQADSILVLWLNADVSPSRSLPACRNNRLRRTRLVERRRDARN